MCSWGFPGGSAIRDLPQHRSRGFDPWSQDNPGRGMAHSMPLAWRIPWTETLAAYSPRNSQRRDTTKVTGVHAHTYVLYDTRVYTTHVCVYTYMSVCLCFISCICFIYTHSSFNHRKTVHRNSFQSFLRCSSGYNSRFGSNEVFQFFL